MDWSVGLRSAVRLLPFHAVQAQAARHHRIPRARYRVTNWPAYKAGLWRRGDLTLWLDEAALGGAEAEQSRRAAAVFRVALVGFRGGGSE